jgi:hypothetical protein
MSPPRALPGPARRARGLAPVGRGLALPALLRAALLLAAASLGRGIADAAPRAAATPRAAQGPAGAAPGVPGSASAQAAGQAPQRCASGPAREAYVSLRAASPSDLAARVAECERLGYRRVGGVARAAVANPGAASAQLYFQVMIVPAGGASAPVAPGSAAR